MSEKKLLIGIILIGALYSYAANNFFAGLMAIPICLQFKYLIEKFANRGALKLYVARFYCGTFLMSFYIYLYSLNYPLNKTYFSSDMTNFVRASLSAGYGAAFSIFLIGTELLLKSFRRDI